MKDCSRCDERYEGYETESNRGGHDSTQALAALAVVIGRVVFLLTVCVAAVIPVDNFLFWLDLLLEVLLYFYIGVLDLAHWNPVKEVGNLIENLAVRIVLWVKHLGVLIHGHGCD